jgi:hypothetical protein
VRVLVTANNAIGHVFPMAPTVRALIEAGNDVVFACPGKAANALIALGVEVREVVPAEFVVLESPPGLSREASFTFAVTTRWPRRAASWMGALLDEARQWHPDLAIVEPIEHAGRITAACLDIPCIEQGWGFTLPASAEHAAGDAIQDLYALAGAHPRTVSLKVDLGPRELQSEVTPKVERFRYEPWSPPAPLLPRDTSRPRVLVTLGTFLNPEAASR